MSGAAVTRVPVVDLERRIAAHLPDIEDAIRRVLDSGRLLDGPEVDAFEAEFAAYTGHRFAVAVGSGTAALQLSLTAIGVGASNEDEVIIPALTAVPTAAAVRAAGATPVFADVDAASAMLDAGAAAAAVTPRTRAVIPVHLYGRPCPLPELGVPVIEDAAQAHGALSPSGSAAVAYSFYPTKNLGALTDGGAVVTNDETVAAKLRRLRAHGRADGYRHVDVATNSRLSEMTAATLRVLLRSLDAANGRRRDIAGRYRAAAPEMGWQQAHPDHVFHLCVARVAGREEWRRRLPFETAVHYPLALPQQPAYAPFVRAECPNAELWAAECVSLPCFPELTDDEAAFVAAALRETAS